jgi:hypothetical protein
MAKKKETPKETTKKARTLASKTLRAFDLMDKDVSPSDAHKLATGNNNPHPRTIDALKKKYDKYLLSKASTVKLASKVYLETMKMTPVKTDEVKVCPECRGKKDDEGAPSPCVTCNSTGIVSTLLYPSHTNRLAAAEAVMERVDPVVRQSMNLNINKTFINIDLESINDCG